jgi:hypothetical protein
MLMFLLRSFLRRLRWKLRLIVYCGPVIELIK